MMTPHRAAAVLGGILTLSALAGCGADGAADLTLSPLGEEGRSIANSNGCSACHGANGQGGVGPAFTGLFGNTVEFDDGSTAVADEAYLREAITDPSARRVAGYQLPMPTNQLSDEQVDAVVAYIRDLAGDTGEVAP